MLILRGASALSAFRLDKLAQKLSLVHPEICLLRSEYVHFCELASPLSGERESVLAKLLSYGPREQNHAAGGPDHDATLMLAVPRPGTISPWSSKATDIAHNSGLAQVQRLERGIAFYLSLPDGLSSEISNTVRDLLHDRMTESVLGDLNDAAQLFRARLACADDHRGCTRWGASGFTRGR